jgi:hypothetical protein
MQLRNIILQVHKNRIYYCLNLRATYPIPETVFLAFKKPRDGIWKSFK